MRERAATVLAASAARAIVFVAQDDCVLLRAKPTLLLALNEDNANRNGA
jgi:hypothetical protein